MPLTNAKFQIKTYHDLNVDGGDDFPEDCLAVTVDLF